VFVFLGLESLNEATLAHIGKPDLLRVGVDGFRERIARIHAHGLGVYGSFVVGLDGDTPAIFDQIRSFTLDAGIDCTLVNILSPRPGTLVWDRMLTEGRLLYTDFPADYALYVQDNVCYCPTGMTGAELQEGTRRLIGALTQPRIVLRRAWATWRRTRNPWAALMALGWNWRTGLALGTFPPRDVRAEPASV
jgi:radical SAM superfamily enzyme YgiQ (UPF0313 family)